MDRSESFPASVRLFEAIENNTENGIGIGIDIAIQVESKAQAAVEAEAQAQAEGLAEDKQNRKIMLPTRSIDRLSLTNQPNSSSSSSQT